MANSTYMRSFEDHNFIWYHEADVLMESEARHWYIQCNLAIFELKNPESDDRPVDKHWNSKTAPHDLIDYGHIEMVSG